ncbi:CD109 antigen [Aplysia californica]|uniref:CD109 antigen n=1 Tax=Aplysia californica TaxID=6500 RepID=A0ABM1AE35_APLCA|nr:CD109 antigen [Aplysia californica]
MEMMMMPPAPPPMAMADFGGPPAPAESASLAEPDRVRTNFVETWLFQTVTTCDSGFATVESTVPDTITSWVASAFAFNSKIELGMAPNQANLRVFRPFFVTLNLPYSVINGEQLALQAIVFNYLNDDAQVRVTLAQSKSFSVLAEEHGLEVLKQEDTVQDVLIKAGEGMSVFFPIVPHELGKIDIEVKAQTTRAADAVRKQLLVEPEGVAKEFNIPVLVELTKETPSFTKIVDLSMPPNVVPGSELMRISAVGDLMGPSIAGLDALLRMPTGCGEQTLLGLAPDVYITDYLSAVNKLHGDIADKALSFMESGYQRELTYKHDDHSFSAFGNNDPSGSMWLTAFVVKVFHQASSHIYVDDNVIIRAINWIINKQNHDGSFPEPGRVIHKNMQGKAGSGTALSLFVFIALLENQDLFKTGSYATKFQSARTNALAYLETQMEHDDDLYNLALASYAFTLAGSSKAQDIITRLNHEATEEDGLKYWHYPETPTTSNPGSWHRPHPTKAIDTEITGYALLTYALCHDLIGGKRIMQWLVQQRNPQGGFVSTQDTVIALNALSEFNRQVYSDNFQVSITTTFNVFQRFRFNIDKTNSLVLQSKDTTRVPSSVKIEARGSGVALVNLAVFFNVLQEVEETFFDLKLSMDDESLNHFSLTVCACWLGEGSASGMAVAEVGVPSGFSVDPDLISDNTLLKRIEVEDRKVILYFDEIGTDDMCLTLTAERSGMVAKCKKAPVVVYDYYEPSNQVTGFYEPKLLKDSKLCDVCKECKGCQDRLQDKRVEFLDFELERV